MRLVTILLCLFPFIMSAQMSDMNQQFLSRLNEVRQSGCWCAPPAPPLKYHTLLERSANLFARDMVDFDYFSHEDRFGGDVASRVDAVGYQWLSVGENLGINQQDVNELVSDWIDSKPHCLMMMDARFKEFGLGNFQNIWVLHLGRPE